VPDGTRLYLETTLVHGGSFTQAMTHAKDTIATQNELKHFDSGLARYVAIRTLRKKGVMPQPDG